MTLNIGIIKRLFLVSLFLLTYGQVDQTAISRQTDYLNSQIKKYWWDQPIYSANINTITPAQYEAQKPKDALSFDCGYLDKDGKIFVSEPSTTSQKRIFRNITEAALYYTNQSFLRIYYKTDKMPLWFKIGFAAFEADLNISDTMIKNAYVKYGNTLPTFNELNNKINFDLNDGIALAYSFGESMNVYYGWWKYNHVDKIDSEKIVMEASEISTDGIYRFWKRYFNSRITESNEQYRIKLQQESEHFKLYYRDAESYCYPYITYVLDEAYKQYVDTLKVASAKKLNFISIPECDFAKIDSVPCGNRYTSGTAWTSGLFMSCAKNADDLEMFKHLARHELSHTFQFLLKPNFMPAWLSEGFASFLPDGKMKEQAIRNQLGFVNHKVEFAKQKIGHYPTIEELENYDFLYKNEIDYYLFGLIMHDFIIKKADYSSIIQIIKSNGQDLSSAGYTTKKEFEKGFYEYYDQTWRVKPKEITIKKVVGSPYIDGIPDEKTWEFSTAYDRKFWTEKLTRFEAKNPPIDNIVKTAIMYDDDNLFIAYDITDKSLSGNTYPYFLNDGIEVVIDPNLSRGVDYKDDDFAFFWNWDRPEPGYWTKLNGAQFVYQKNSSGYTIEISIPWKKLGITPEKGKKFGLDLLNYDNDENQYQGALVYCGYTFNGGVSLNGLAEFTLSDEKIYAPASCKFTSFTNNSTLIAGDTLLLKWNYTNISNMRIEFSTNGGTDWSVIKKYNTSKIFATDSLLWVCPNIQSNNVKFRIADETSNTILDVTKNPIAIILPNSLGGPYVKNNSTTLLIHFDNNFEKISSYKENTEIINNVKLVPNTIKELGNAAEITNTGTSSCIKIPHHSLLNLTENWTIELWFKVRNWGTATTAYPFLLFKTGANYFIILSPQTNSLRAGYDYEGGAEQVVLPNNSLKLNKWYHLSFIRNTSNTILQCILRDSTRAILLNSSQKYNPQHIPKTNTEALNIGGVSYGSNIQFDGFVDELRISNSVIDYTVDTEMEHQESKPESFSLKQNYPNPFNPSTKIIYSIPRSGFVKLKVYDMLGKEICTLVNEEKIPGEYEIIFNGNGLSSGIYFYKLFTEGFNQTRKMILVK